MWYWHDGWGLGMGLIMVAVWLPLLLALVWFVARPWGRGPGRDDGPDALEAARRAYARGDIDRERYLQIVQDLGGALPRGGDNKAA